ncbi:hypothetical protein [Paenibacillus larvae]|uniref:Uncharacterized protein n=2 Tax=Paenibacillus larvae TaxID=1464 RepID=V9W5X4_9BACL|nr:hypothetical protein [Paenibacillus larvae]AHD05324.1 hypothetical protein ERIC2_c14980 [Paenibacillus larvae subsp. larvae DSM 25430]AVG11871.1 hypothetical protein ERICII_01470 [Paenibacillus larvae subsp. larvae DSM 25430]MDR5584264.1 hypothetical protein [Paenibacillus larvae]MDR5595623.1 hypothetical protein [Paenibacillus larvae]MDR5600050.1 hypothetical protein [Paenibacillus larvae]
MNFLSDFNELLLLHLKIRIRGQFSLLFTYTLKFLNKWSRTKVYILFLFIKISFSFLSLWVIWNYIYKEQYSFYWSASILLFFLIYPAIVGMFAWKRTHVPVYEEFLLASSKSETYIFGLLAAEEFIWSIMNNIGLYTTLLGLIAFIHELAFIEALLGCILLAIISFGLFLISNRLLGNYIIYKICRPISWIRLFVYLIVCVICLGIGFLAVGQIIPYIRAFRTNITSLQALTSEEIWNRMIHLISVEWNQDIQQLLHIIYHKNLPHIYLHEQFHHPNLLNLFALCAGCFVVIFMIMSLFPYKYNKFKLTEHKDFLHYYITWLKQINKLVYRCDCMLEKEITLLGRNRQHVSSGFFSLAVAEIEIFFYSGITLGLGQALHTEGFIISIICIFTMLAVANHASAIRSEYPFLFLLSSEGRNIDLIRLSGNSSRLLFDAKMKLMRIIMIIPTLVMLIIVCILCIIWGFSASCSLILVIIIISYWILPFFELYSSPFISKFNFKSIQEIGKTKEELELRTLVDTAPRRFIIVPIMIILYFGAFIIPSWAASFLPLFITGYFTLSSLIFFQISKKITAKGLKEIDNRVWIES